VVLEDAASGMSQIHAAEIKPDIWTLTRFPRHPIKNTYGQIETPETGSSSDNESLRDRTLSVPACLTCNYLRARPGRKRQLMQAAQHSVPPPRSCFFYSLSVRLLGRGNRILKRTIAVCGRVSHIGHVAAKED
jgi:hypothetical protein